MGWIFDTSQFIARSHCGVGWTNTLILLSQLYNFLIALSYFAISATLIYFWLKIKHLPQYKDVPTYILAMFSVFIWSCGATHVFDVVVFYWPAYRFSILLDAITAISSIGTALVLTGVINHLLRSSNNAD